MNGTNVPVVGTWFNKNLKISTGETTVVGVEGMRSWWQLDGKWPKDDSDQGVIGKTLASELGVTTGDTITLNKTTASGKKNEQKIKLTGVYDSGDEDNGSLYIALLHGPGTRRPARFGRQNRGQGPDHAGERPGP